MLKIDYQEQSIALLVEHKRELEESLGKFDFIEKLSTKYGLQSKGHIKALKQQIHREIGLINVTIGEKH